MIISAPWQKVNIICWLTWSEDQTITMANGRCRRRRRCQLTFDKHRV